MLDVSITKYARESFRALEIAAEDVMEGIGTTLEDISSKQSPWRSQIQFFVAHPLFVCRSAISRNSNGNFRCRSFRMTK
jgi:hypothetical protein